MEDKRACEDIADHDFNVVKVINGDESTINNKDYYGFKTVDQMVQMLSDQHTIDNVLTRKFPVCLLKGSNGENLVPVQDM